MLTEHRAYLYVVDRDFGFAPNPFHGVCTLATCKPAIRKSARIGDWVIGIGGNRLKASGHCIYAMQINQIISFDDYWNDPAYAAKKPVRNGSSKMLVGDNIYHHDLVTNEWEQANSHHSNADGTPNEYNLAKDTRVSKVLLSDYFFYFGRLAPEIPKTLLENIGYKNGRSHRVYPVKDIEPILKWLTDTYSSERSLVTADPFDFENSNKRYSPATNKII